MAAPKSHDQPVTHDMPSTASPEPVVVVASHGYTAPAGGVVEGQAYMIDGHLVVAAATVGAGATVTGRTGVIEYAKVHEQAWTAGDDIFWDAAGGCLSNSAVKVDGSGGANVRVGTADKDAPRPSVTGFVRLAR